MITNPAAGAFLIGKMDMAFDGSRAAMAQCRRNGVRSVNSVREALHWHPANLNRHLKKPATCREFPALGLFFR
jgi:hypothetical protein